MRSSFSELLSNGELRPWRQRKLFMFIGFHWFVCLQTQLPTVVSCEQSNRDFYWVKIFIRELLHKRKFHMSWPVPMAAVPPMQAGNGFLDPFAVGAAGAGAFDAEYYSSVLASFHMTIATMCTAASCSFQEFKKRGLETLSNPSLCPCTSISGLRHCCLLKQPLEFQVQIWTRQDSNN